MSGDWRDQAACVGHDPEMWFPLPPMHSDRARSLQIERDRKTARARAICRACPVIEQCAQDALSDPDLVGIWAGMDADERRAYARAKRRSRPRAYGRADAALRRLHPQQWDRLHAEAVKAGIAADPYAHIYRIRKRATSVAYSALRRLHPEQHASLRAELRNDEVAAIGGAA